MTTTMIPSPYVLEFYGGRFDGFQQPCDVIPLSTHLEMPGPELAIGGRVAERIEVYEHRRTTVAFVEESPVVTFHYRHAGSKIAAPRPKSPTSWAASLRTVLRRICRPGGQIAKVPPDRIPAPDSREQIAMHTRN